MSWRELRNAPLIEAYVASQRRAAPNVVHTVLNSKLPAVLWDRLVAEGRERALVDLHTANHAYLRVLGYRTLAALTLWDDMPAILKMSNEELGAMLRMFPDTELAERVKAAVEVLTEVGRESINELCASIANRAVDEGSNGAPDVAASERGGGEESKGNRDEAP